MILDTSFLVDLKEGKEGALQKTRDLNQRDETGHISLISVYELRYGVEHTQSDKEERLVENLLLMYPILDLNEEILRLAADLSATADKNTQDEGPNIDQLDPVIAATAEYQEEVILTDNVDDFQELGVAYESY